MPIDLSKVEWDTPPAAGAIDASKVQWDAEPAARSTDAVPQGRTRGGFARQVGEAFTKPAETPEALPLASLAKGAAQGVPSAILGLPGDVLSLAVDNPIKSSDVADYLFGPAQNKGEAAGRVTGGMFGGLLGPGAASALGPVREAAAAAKYGTTAAALRGAQTVLDPVSPLVSGAVGLGARGVNLLARGVERARAPFTPTANLLIPAMEGRLPEAVTALRNAKEVLPGSPATAAEVLVGEGFKGTQFPAMQQNLLRKYASTDAEALAAQQRAAQQGAIASIGGTPAELEAAVAARSAAATASYRKALQPLVESDPTFQTLLETPAMQKAIPAAAERASNRQRNFRMGEDIPAYETPSSVVGPNGEPLMRQVPAEFAQYPGQSLQDIKISLDSMLESKSYGPAANPTSLSKSQLADIKNVRDQFVSWMESKLPDYKGARQQFAKASEGINVRQVGQQLEKSLTSPLNENVTRAGQFAQAVENAPSTIKKATGDARYSTLSDIFETGDSLKVARVLEDLSRTAEYQRLARLGRSEALGAASAAELPKAPNTLGLVRTVASRLLNALEGKINESTALAIAKASLDPKLMAAMLEKAAAQAKRTKEISGNIRAKAPTDAQGKAARINALRPLVGLGESDNANAMAR
jgi:hypothetical protein